MSTAMTVHTGEPGAQLQRASEAPRLLRPIAPPDEIITAQEQARDLVTKALKQGRDYGEVPGTDRQTLLKAGAERLSIGFGLVARYNVLEKEADHDRPVHWRKEKKVFQRGQYVRTDVLEGDTLGLYRVVIECELVDRATGQVVGSSIASCSTMESKYIERPRDSENTVYKMAAKRAHVGATLNALGLSDQFTQDVEDTGPAAAAPAAGDGGASSSEGEDEGPPAVDNSRSCPKCGGGMYDNRQTKRNPKAPDFKCKDRSCDGVIWPPKEGASTPTSTSTSETSGGSATTSGAASSGKTDAPAHGTLAWAAALPLMGKPTSWTHDGISYGRKPIGEVPTPALKQAAHFFKAKIEEGQQDDDRLPAMRDQVKAIALVVDDRAKLDPKQEDLALDGARTAPTPVNDPAARRIADAEAAIEKGALEEDDLPF